MKGFWKKVLEAAVKRAEEAQLNDPKRDFPVFKRLTFDEIFVRMCGHLKDAFGASINLDKPSTVRNMAIVMAQTHFEMQEDIYQQLEHLIVTEAQEDD